MICPDCSKTLIDVATSCRCGWRAAPNAFSPNTERAKCSHEGCYLPNVAGMADQCEHHYLQHRQAEANATCSALGLETVEQKRAWFRAHAKRVYRPVAYADSSAQRETARQVAYGEVTVEREPGQDDEERAS